MQPYFFPYIGYFQLIAAVDQFVVYDNIKYTKKGWVSRNRLLLNGSDELFSLSIKKDSDYLNICDRELVFDFSRQKLLNQFYGVYRHAPYFQETYSLIEKVISFDSQNLFSYIYNSIVTVCDYLEVNTKIVISSEMKINHSLKGVEKVLALCKVTGASIYINPIGGVNLYKRNQFESDGLDLFFLDTRLITYPQFGSSFVPNLSIIDVLMFNQLSQVKSYLKNFDLIRN